MSVRNRVEKFVQCGRNRNPHEVRMHRRSARTQLRMWLQKAKLDPELEVREPVPREEYFDRCVTSSFISDSIGYLRGHDAIIVGFVAKHVGSQIDEVCRMLLDGVGSQSVSQRRFRWAVERFVREIDGRRYEYMLGACLYIDLDGIVRSSLNEVPVSTYGYVREVQAAA